jgi:aquaporin Z
MVVKSNAFDTWRSTLSFYLLKQNAVRAMHVSGSNTLIDQLDSDLDMITNIPPRPIPSTKLAPSATLAHALGKHWREYLMEAAELATLMFFICLFETLIYSGESPLRHWELSNVAESFLMGSAVAVTTWLIIQSPLGRRTGAHFNPAITLTYFYLNRVHRWDTFFYIVFQFVGSIIGVLIAHEFLGHRLATPPVSYVITTPGSSGTIVAFVAEFVLSGLLMGIVLFATNMWPLAKFSPIMVAGITVLYYVLCPSLSGYSVNPARSFSSAFFAGIWHGIWIYFAAPCTGMLAAAVTYLHWRGSEKVYCAKIFHDLHSVCPFNCHFDQLRRKT